MIKMLGKKVAISLTKKSSRRGDFILPEEASESVGTIKFISDEAAEKTGLKPGDKVFFFNSGEKLKIKDEVLQIMDVESIVALELEPTQ